MRALRFRRPSDPSDRVGLVVDQADPWPEAVEVADLTDLISGVNEPFDVVRVAAVDRALLDRGVARAIHVEVRLEQVMAPVPHPPKFFGIGYNYRAHAEEARAAIGAFPLFFNKQVTCVSGPCDDVPLPSGCHQLDYEGELAFVVGRRCRNVPVERAPEVIGAWLACDDISARDWQRQTPTVTMGKSHDGFGPTGPWLVTCDEVADPHDLMIRTTVNGEQRQLGSTRDMTYNVYEQIAALTSWCTLEPGDLVTTGSPAGSAQGMSEPRWLQAGDIVRVEVEGIGALENRVVADAAETFIAPLAPCQKR
jgi:2-keto-4-pentenoate hydratase/2-oxohepta-3-ene-1,7-dioic acid hydratase in catechol pathway